MRALVPPAARAPAYLGGQRLPPKPKVEIDGRPILWHIIMIYSHYDFKDLTAALECKDDNIARYLSEYRTFFGDLSIRVESACANRLPPFPKRFCKCARTGKISFTSSTPRARRSRSGPRLQRRVVQHGRRSWPDAEKCYRHQSLQAGQVSPGRGVQSLDSGSAGR